MRRALAGFLWLALLAPAAASAQIAGPAFVFTNGTVINADEVNADFAAVYAAACNRTGCTMSGPLIFSPDNTIDIGASGTTRPRDLWLGRNATIGGTVTGATFSGSGASLTGIPETAITDGALLARVAANETIAGVYTFTAGRGIEVLNTSPFFWFNESDAGANATRYRMGNAGGLFTFETVNDAESATAPIFTVARTGTTVNSFTIGAAQTNLATGTTPAPALTFGGDTDTGFSSGGPNVMNVVTGGTLRWQFDSSGNLLPAADLTSSLGSTVAGINGIFLDNGTNSNPAIRFRNDPDSGIYWDNAGGNLLITVNSSDAWSFGATGANFTSALSANGASSPSFRATGVTFANIATTPAGLTNGTILYCTDCTIASPCAGGGTGAIAKRLNATWVCN